MSGSAPATPPPAPSREDSSVHAFAMLGGLERKSATPDFRGGDMTAIMGGCKVDLRQAGIASGRAVVDVVAIWGGVEIRVPADWTVVVEGTPILGAIEDKTVRPSGGAKILVVRGVAIMGGVEIGN